MGNVTLEIGPPWKMELLRDVLAEHGVPSFVVDSNIKTIDPFLTGALSFDARLDVPEEAAQDARAALAAARAEGAALQATPEGRDEAEEAPDPVLEELTDLGRRIRWAVLLFWVQPFAFVYGWRYLSRLSLARRRPPGHAFTLLALAGVTVIWCTVIAATVRAFA